MTKKTKEQIWLIVVFTTMAAVGLWLLSLTPAQAADANQCVQQRWNGVIKHGLPLQKAFNMNVLTPRSVGPDYRSMDAATKKAAYWAVTYALQDALNEHLGRLRKVKLKFTGAPSTSSRKIRVQGEFIHPTGRYSAQAWILKGDCRIIAMLVEKTWIVDWIQETPRFKAFLAGH